MNRLIASIRPAFVLAFGLSLGACAVDTGETIQGAEELSAWRCPRPMPPVGAAGTSLTPAPDQRLLGVLHAVGTQNYVCNAAGTAWTFTGPVANLLGPGGHVIGTHFASAAGPTRPAWRFIDGSTVVMQKVGGTVVDPTAVPWLLLTAVSYEGDGLFEHVSSVQRLNTRGGLAPAAPCAPGAEARVNYETDYFFYVTGRGNPSHNPQCQSTL